MDALLVLVTDGIVERLRRKSPWRRHVASVGMSLFSMYSRPNPSSMITTARCCGRCANAGPARSTALEVRNSRRESEEALISVLPNLRRGLQHRKVANKLRKGDSGVCLLRQAIPLLHEEGW